MNFGQEDYKEAIRQFCESRGVRVTVPGGQGKFYKDLGKHLHGIFEGDDMQREMKTMARAKGISEEVINYTDRICRVFSFSVVQLDPIAISVYEWMIEQEKNGQTVEQFAEWAKNPERIKFINKYRNSAGNFKNDWILAFSEKQSAPLRNEDGSLNV